MTDKNQIQCVVCASNQVSATANCYPLNVPFIEDQYVEVSEYSCSSCGAQWVLDDETLDRNTKLAVQRAKQQSLPLIFDQLKKMEISQAYFERAYELSPRTLGRWKSGSASEAALALLRVTATYPWVTDVAAQGFTQEAADKAVMREGAKLLNQYLIKNKIDLSTEIRHEGLSMHFTSGAEAAQPEFEVAA